MAFNKKLSAAISALLGAQQAYSLPTDDSAVAGGASTEISEITVTAQRRSQSIQDVPITIQALSAETMAQLDVSTFDDLVRYLPNVTTASFGPGQGNIYMRGLSSGAFGVQLSGGVGGWPNVAVYLDEQPAMTPGRNLDIYAADLERIEVLEGPQGTLFGAGAQAGVLRYITNKPKLNTFEANVTAGYGATAHGDPNSRLDATINLPLIDDTLAVRAVIYNDARGGYINNVPGTFVRSNSDIGIHYAGGSVPTNSEVINNHSLVQNAINPVSYQGIRVEALYAINDDWSALLTQSYQDMNAQGVFYETPTGVSGEQLPSLSVQLFNPSYDKDRFENTALTITGRVGDLKAVYSGSYLVRNVAQQQDYTNYARGLYADYYQCTPASKTQSAVCYSPSSTWLANQRDTHQSQEIRLSTPDEWRLRALGGVFWEDVQLAEDIEFRYKTDPQFIDIAPPADSSAINPNVRTDGTAFINDITRGYRQTAAFGSVDFDLIPNALTLTAGTRYYKFENSEVGSTVSSFGCSTFYGAIGPAPCATESAINLDSAKLRSTYSGFKSRANVSWKATRDVLLYYTWSQGFRPGGFNRSSTGHVPEVIDGIKYNQFYVPLDYAPDTLINNEIGWKTLWLDRRLEFNGAVYQEDWKNTQVRFLDEGVLGNLAFTTNGPNYRVRGVEYQVVARVTRGLTITSSASWNSSNQTNSPYLPVNNPLAPNYGQSITSISNPYGPLNSPLADSPPFQGNLRARYEFLAGEYHAFCQVGGMHQGHSYSATGNVQAYDMPGFTTYDASLGVSKDAWTVQLVGENITNTLADLYTSSSQHILTETVNRPRTIGVTFSYRFEGASTGRTRKEAASSDNL